MSSDLRIVGLCGSLRAGSYTRVGLSLALEEARDAGAETALIDLDDYDIPLFNDDHDRPANVEEVAELLGDADAILLGTPMYHGSYSGVLKNTIDHMGFDEFEDKTVGLLVVSGGGFPLSALEHLRTVCRSLNAWVLPWDAAIPRARTVIEDGHIADEQLANRVRVLGRRVVEYARIEPHQESLESEQNVGAVGR